MRTRSGKLNADTMQRIGDMYDRLNNACVNGVRDYGCFDSRDLFHDTMIEVSRENLGPMTDTEFIAPLRLGDPTCVGIRHRHPGGGRCAGR